MVTCSSPDCNSCSFRSKSVFSNVSVTHLNQMNAQKHSLRFKPGELIFKEGAAPKGIYCVYKGKVSVCRECNAGESQVLRFAGPGDIMGYRAVLGNDVFSCSAVATTDTQVCVLPVETFFDLLETDTRLSFQVLDLMSRELKRIEAKFTNTTKRTVKEKLAQSLLLLVENYGYEKDGRTLNMKLKRNEIASIVGTTRETVTRMLYALRDEKVVDIIGKKIRIINAQALLTIAGNTPPN